MGPTKPQNHPGTRFSLDSHFIRSIRSGLGPVLLQLVPGLFNNMSNTNRVDQRRPGHNKTVPIMQCNSICGHKVRTMLTLPAVSTNKLAIKPASSILFFLVQKGKRSKSFLSCHMQQNCKDDSKRVAFVFRHHDSNWPLKLK